MSQHGIASEQIKAKSDAFKTSISPAFSPGRTGASNGFNLREAAGTMHRLRRPSDKLPGHEATGRSCVVLPL